VIWCVVGFPVRVQATKGAPSGHQVGGGFFSQINVLSKQRTIAVQMTDVHVVFYA